jgi:hypothetical protein
MSDQTKLTEEQIREQMKAAGIDPGKWGEMGGGGPRTPKFALRLAHNLARVRGVLESAVEAKQSEVQSLEEKLLRLKHGGGS